MLRDQLGFYSAGNEFTRRFIYYSRSGYIGPRRGGENEPPRRNKRQLAVAAQAGDADAATFEETGKIN